MKRYLKYLLMSFVLCITPCLFVACKKDSNKFSVEIPEIFDGCGYEIVLPESYNESSGEFEVKENGNYSFTLIIDDMYDLSQVVVKANGNEIAVNKNLNNNTITVTNDKVTSNTKYTIHNLVKKQLSANFNLAKYSMGNFVGTISTLGLDEIKVKIGNKEYTLNSLVENNVNLFSLYGEEIVFLVKPTIEDKYSNLEKLFVIGCENFTYDNTLDEYLPNSNASYLVKGLTRDEEGWLPFSLRLTESTQIYINNECLKIDQKYLIQESGLDIKEKINTIYGKNINILESLTNPNKISLNLINVKFYVENNWQTTIPTNAGEYKSRIVFAGNDLYKPFEKEFTFTIEKRTIVYNILDSTILYKEKLKVNILEDKQLSMGFVNSGDIKKISLTQQILDDNNNICSDTNNLNIGKYKINVIATSDNYNIIFNNLGTLTINPANLPENIVDVKNIAKTYDNEYAQISVNLLEEFKGIVSVVYKPFKFNGPVKEYLTPTLNPPKFKDVYNGGVDIEIFNANYNVKTITVDVNIAKATLSSDQIKIDNVEVVYDGNPHSFNVEISNDLNLSDFVITFNGLESNPVMINANEDNFEYFNIVFASKNYEDFTLNNKYIQIKRADVIINKTPTHKPLYVGDVFTNECLSSDYEIMGINNEIVNGNFSVLEETNIISSTQTIPNILFVPNNNNYNSIELNNYTISATQLTLNVPKGLAVKDVESLASFNEGLNNVDNNTNLLIILDEIEGFEITTVKANNINLQFENGEANYLVNCDNVELVIEYKVKDLEISKIDDLIDIQYNYGSVMGERVVQVSHPIATNFTYKWYKLNSNIDIELVENEEINDELIKEKFSIINNNTNTLSINNCNQEGFYVVRVETIVIDIEENEINLVKFSNIISVTTEKLRCYFVEAPTYLASTGDLVKNIEFTEGKVITSTGVVVAGEIRAINIKDTDVVDVDGIA